MPYPLNEERVRVLKRDHDESTARTIAALEQIENRLLDTMDRRPLRDDEKVKLDKIQADLRALCYPDAPADPRPGVPVHDDPMPYAGDGASDADADADSTDADAADGLATGDRVRMLCGPCAGMEGVIVCPDADGSYTMQTDAGASLTVDPCDVDVLPDSTDTDADAGASDADAA